MIPSLQFNRLLRGVLLCFTLFFSVKNSFAQLTEGFESTIIPATNWTYTSVTHGTNNPRTGSRCATFNANNDAIVTPLIASPGTLTFWYRRSATSPTSPGFTVAYSSSTSGPWTTVGTVTSFSTTYASFTYTFSSLSNIYIRVLHTRTAGANEIYLDDFSVTNGCINVGISSISSTTPGVCPSATVNLSAVGVVGTSAVVNWYSSPGGVGLLGTGTSLNNVGAGTYYARVTGTCGSPQEVSTTISAYAAANTSSITGNTTPSCFAANQTYSVSLTTGSFYAWTVPSGASINSGATGPNNHSVSVSFSNLDGNISVIETTSNGCIGATQILPITLQGCGIDADFTASATSVCQGLTVTFTNTSLNTSSNTTYAWDFGAGSSPSTASGIGPHSVTYNTPGNATVSLTITDGTSNTETKNNYITVIASPSANAGAGVPSVCAGTPTAALNGSFGGSATSAIWSDGGAGGSFQNNSGSTPQLTTYTPAISATGNILLTLTANSPSCGTSTDDILVTILPAPLVPVANGGTSPQILSVTNDSFTANWTTNSGETYFIDVATSPTFSIGGTFLTEGFNGTLSNFNISSGTGAYYSGNSATGDRPASSPFSTEGSNSFGKSNGEVIITSNTIDASSYNNISLTFDLASFSIGSTGNGADAADFISVEISTDGGTNYYNTLEVLGNNNAYWSFAATGDATAAYDADNTPLVFQPAGGGNRTTDGYSDITITNIPSTSGLRIRITLLNNTSNERWLIDNLQLTGNGSSFVPGYENLAVSTSPLNVIGLNDETTYYYRIRSTNGCGTSANSNVVEVTTSCPAPTIAPSNLVFNNITETSLDLSWTQGNGSQVLILCKQGSAPTGSPIDNTTYSFDSNFNLAPLLGDAVIVYIGSNTSTSITGLTPGTDYYFTIIEFNCGASREKYSNLVLSGTTVVRPSNVILSENCTTNSTHELEWSFGLGNNAGVKIFARPLTPSSGPGVQTPNTFIGANADYNLAADFGARGRLIYDGNGTSVTVSGLLSNTLYHFSAYTYTNASVNNWSTGATVSQLIGVSEITTLNATPGNEEASIGWTNPALQCFDEILVVASQGSVSFTPSGDGSAYIANNVFSSNNQVVYKGTGNNVLVTGLTNGLQYCFKVFVRKGTEWSFGLEVCTVPTTVTEFAPGDLAIIAVNTQVLGSGSTDEICFVSFKEITEGTSFYITDNGYERAIAERWGDTEGVASFTRNIGAPTIPAGTVICINGPFSSEPRYEIILCGALDNSNWTINADVIGAGATTFDLNSSDQVWIMQGGTWTNPVGAQNATYDGNPLYGWSGIEWKDNIGSTAPTWTTAGSRLIPRTECFTTTLDNLPNNSKSKYVGPMTETTRLGWITRINDASNWLGYATNGDYDNAGIAFDYYNECIVLPLAAPTEIAGRWLGSKNEDWFDCANWDTKTVPDSTIHVIIENVAGLNSNCKVDITAPNASLFNNEASCADMTIVEKELILQADIANQIIIHGDLTIETNGTLNMDDGAATADGTVILLGDWINTSNTNFLEGNGSVILEGTSNQSISSLDNETFYNLEINNPFGISLLHNTSVAGNLTLTNGVISNPSDTLTLGINASQTGMLNYLDGHVTGVFQRWVNGANQSLLFPVGSAITPQLASINFNNTATGTIALSFDNTSPTNTGLPIFDNGVSLENNFTEGFWRTSVDAGIVNPNFNISLTPSDFSSFALNNQSRIVERIDNVNWIVQGAHGGLTSGVISRNNISIVGEFAIASGRECVTEVVSPTPLSQEICVGDAILPVSINTVGGQGTINYQWYFGVLNNTTSGNSLGALNGAQTSSYNIPADFDSNGYFYCIVTQPGSACPPVVSSTSQINFSTPLNPSISISSDVTEICGNTNTVNFTSNGNELGSNPTYQWYLNGNPVDTNNPTFVLSNAADGDVVYVVVTPSESCKNIAFAQSNNIALSVIASNTFYQDLDGDGFGNQSVSINTCVQPIGYVPAPVGDLNFDGQPDFDCNDSNEDVNPSLDEICSPEDDNCDGFINEGYAATLYYQDLDGDTFGNPLVTVSTCSIPPLGYVLNNSDCDDTNAAVRPNATEICDGIDNDCDATIDEGCGPINDLRLAALIIYPNVLGSCSQNIGTLIGATISPESQSNCPTGEDVWYYFTATSSAVSILCNSTNTNVLIELQHENGSMIEVENIQSSDGLERLNYSGLTPGMTYFISVRNHNSNITAGSDFTICVQRILSSSCDLATPSPSLCAAFKATFTNANQYIYHFGSTIVNGPYATTVAGSGNTLLPLASVPGLTYGMTVTVSVDAVYTLPNGLGVMENITVPGLSSCTFTTAAQPNIYVRAIDSCPNAKSLNAIIRAEPNICGQIIDYEWEFTEVLPNPGLPVTAFRGAADRYWRISWIPGVIPGGQYSVRIRPIFAGNVPGAWSTTPSCIRVIGAALSMKEPILVNQQYAERSLVTEGMDMDFSIFPNPTNGDAVTIVGTSTIEGSYQIRITDALGKIVFTDKIYREQGAFNHVIVFEQRLGAGLYMIEWITPDNLKTTEKLVVQN